MTHTNRALAELNYSFPRSYTARRVLFYILPPPLSQQRSSCSSERGAVTAAGPGPACPALPPPDPPRPRQTLPGHGAQSPHCAPAPARALLGSADAAARPGSAGRTGQHRRQGPRPQQLSGAPAVLPPAARAEGPRPPSTSPALTAATSATLFVHVGTAGRALRGGRGSGRPGTRSSRSAPRGHSCSFPSFSSSSSFSFFSSSSFFAATTSAAALCCYALPPRSSPPNPASAPAAATASAQPPAPLM